MSWVRKILGGSTARPEPWCGRVVPREFCGYEGVVSLVPCAVELRGEQAAAVAERIDQLVGGLPLSRLPHLDRALRNRSCWQGGWFGEKRLRRVLPAHLPEYAGLFLCLALCHPSGYVRQAAIPQVVRRLGSGALVRHSAFALPLLVLRRNDWVDAVAASAAGALDRLLAQGPAEHWIAALPLVDRLSGLGRRDHAQFVEAVREASRSEAWARPLLEGVRSSDRHVARSAVRLALGNAALPRPEVVGTALDALDPIVRLVAARAAESEPSGDQRVGLLRRLETDPYMPVRREALRLRGEWLPDTLGEAYRRLLFDPGPGLRAEAQAETGRCGRDAAEAYRQRLRGTPPGDVTTALHGLAEVGIASDAELAESFLHAPGARSRAAALRCVARHAGGDYTDALVSALEDASSRVSRAAAAGLRGRVHRAGLDRILATLDRQVPGHVRRTVIRLLFESDAWAPLAPLVRCLAEGEQGGGPWAAGMLDAWFTRHRGWTRRPPEPRIAALRDALDECGSRLSAARRRELGFLLETLREA